MTPRDAAVGGLGLLSLALLAVIAIEAFQAPAPAPAAAAPAAPSALPAAQVDDSSSFLPTILARPLFALDRRPKESPTAVGAPTDDMPRLAGIMIDQSQRRAIFQPSGDAKPVSLTEGDQIAGWQIQQIAADGVTLAGPKGTETLQPKPDPALAAAAAAGDNANPAPNGVPGLPPRPGQTNPRQFLPGGMQLPPGVPNPFAGQPAPPQPRPAPPPPTRQPGGAPAAPSRR
ncbi:MAG TPA: hypothetical protein VKQ29_16445 [Aliidongia sp.]|nr:hypothetical protein [Aliidongia sp.]